MSDAQYFCADQAINPYYSDPNTDVIAAQREHDSIAACFEKAGINVVKVAAPPESQDGVYTANWALVQGNLAILARLPAVRKAEEAYARRILESLGKTVISVPDGLRFSGQGDALPCGPYLICGMGYRSDEAAQTFAAETLGLKRVQIQAIPQLDAHGDSVINAVSGWPDSFFYDIDLAVGILRQPSAGTKGLIAYCPEALTKESCTLLESLPDIETVHVSLQEATEGFALNLVSTGTTVIMSAHAPVLQKALLERGFTVYTPSIQELAKGGGYIRCTSLTISSSSHA